MALTRKPDPVVEREELKWIDGISDLLDTRFRIPMTNIRFGADFLLGLIPGVGDVISFGVSGILILTMARHGVSVGVLLKMIGNLILDAVFGSIPIVGNLFDLGYKANRRNFDILQRYYAKGKPRANTGRSVLVVLGILLLVLIALIVLLWQLIAWLVGVVF